MSASATPFDQLLTEAARIFADSRRRRDALSPEQAAEEAFIPGGRWRTARDLAEFIRQQRVEARAERLAAERLATPA